MHTVSTWFIDRSRLKQERRVVRVQRVARGVRLTISNLTGRFCCLTCACGSMRQALGRATYDRCCLLIASRGKPILVLLRADAGQVHASQDKELPLQS